MPVQVLSGSGVPGLLLGREKPGGVPESLLYIGNLRVTVTRLLPKTRAGSMRYHEAGLMLVPSPEALRAVLTDGAARPWQDPGACRAGGQMPLGLSRGPRTFEVPADGSGGTALRVREERTGPLPGLTRRPVPDAGPSSGRFAQGIWRRAWTGR